MAVRSSAAGCRPGRAGQLGRSHAAEFLAHQRPKRRSMLNWQPRAHAPPVGGDALCSHDLPLEQQPQPIAPPPSIEHQGGEPQLENAAAGPASSVVTALQAALSKYDELLVTHPVLTKAATSCIGFAIGDRLAQSIGGGVFDPWRAVRLSLYGLLVDGPVGHAWYALLDKYVEPENPRGTRAVLIKTFLDQTVWAIPMTCIFFALVRTLEGHPELIVSTIQDKLWHVYMGNLMVWPLAHLVNFRFVPTDYRIAFNNAISIAWNCWLSLSCAGPGHGNIDSSSGFGGHGAGLGELPCHKPASVAEALHITDAVRQVAGMERLLAAWGGQALPGGPDSEVGSALIRYFVDLKVDVAERVCGVPTHSVPPKF